MLRLRALQLALALSAALWSLNLDSGYKFTRTVRLAVDVFNLFNAANSDIVYFYTSRRPGEPLGGIDDIHLHPSLPRTARLSLILGF